MGLHAENICGMCEPRFLEVSVDQVIDLIAVETHGYADYDEVD